METNRELLLHTLTCFVILRHLLEFFVLSGLIFVESLQPPKIKTTKDFLCLLSKCFKLANLLLLIFAVTKVCFLLALFLLLPKFVSFSLFFFSLFRHFASKKLFSKFPPCMVGYGGKKKETQRNTEIEKVSLFFFSPFPSFCVKKVVF